MAKRKTIESWKVIMATTDGEVIEFDEVPEEAASIIDEAIKETHKVSWA